MASGPTNNLGSPNKTAVLDPKPRHQVRVFVPRLELDESQ